MCPKAFEPGGSENIAGGAVPCCRGALIFLSLGKKRGRDVHAEREEGDSGWIVGGIIEVMGLAWVYERESRLIRMLFVCFFWDLI